MKTQIEQYIKTWQNRCYSNGIPDEVPKCIHDLVPSYKRIALAILKHDTALKTLGFEPKKSKYYSELKRIEISKRPTNKPIQLKLNLLWKQ